MTPNNNGWTEYRKQVLTELEHQRAELAIIHKEVIDLKIKMAVAQTKLSLTSGVISLVISTIVGAILQLVLK